MSGKAVPPDVMTPAISERRLIVGMPAIDGSTSPNLHNESATSHCRPCGLLHIPMQRRLYHHPFQGPGASGRLALRAFAPFRHVDGGLAQDRPVWMFPEFTRLFGPDCSG